MQSQQDGEASDCEVSGASGETPQADCEVSDTSGETPRAGTSGGQPCLAAHLGAENLVRIGRRTLDLITRSLTPSPRPITRFLTP